MFITACEVPPPAPLTTVSMRMSVPAVTAPPVTLKVPELLFGPAATSIRSVEVNVPPLISTTPIVSARCAPMAGRLAVTLPPLRL
jgi:hypothetical protein